MQKLNLDMDLMHLVNYSSSVRGLLSSGRLRHEFTISDEANIEHAVQAITQRLVQVVTEQEEADDMLDYLDSVLRQEL
eukprot:11677478-Alexandrium_andersonii.AAC.1